MLARDYTDEDFDQSVLHKNNQSLAVIEFWAEWCAPCLAMAPSMEELAKEYAGRATIGKINMDKNIILSFRYQIKSLPTILFFKGGKIIEQHVGSLSKVQLRTKIEEHLAGHSA